MSFSFPLSRMSCTCMPPRAAGEDGRAGAEGGGAVRMPTAGSDVEVEECRGGRVERAWGSSRLDRTCENLEQAMSAKERDAESETAPSDVRMIDVRMLIGSRMLRALLGVWVGVDDADSDMAACGGGGGRGVYQKRTMASCRRLMHKVKLISAMYLSSPRDSVLASQIDTQEEAKCVHNETAHAYKSQKDVLEVYSFLSTACSTVPIHAPTNPERNSIISFVIGRNPRKRRFVIIY